MRVDVEEAHTIQLVPSWLWTLHPIMGYWTQAYKGTKFVVTKVFVGAGQVSQWSRFEL